MKKNASPLKLTPATPCCDSCVLGALQLAGFNYALPFVVVSNLDAQPARARTAMIESLLQGEDRVFLVISNPPPPQQSEEDAPQTDASADGGDEPLDEKTLRDLLSLDDSELADA